MKHFHTFRLDTTNHCLWRGDERVSLTPKAFDLLRYLVEHADRLVTQEEILEALWADTFVNQEVVKKYVLGIRKVLGDRHDKPMFIRTFPRRGYQLFAPVTDEYRMSIPHGVTSPRSIVDRGAARSQLEDCFERVRRGERQVVFVTGSEGVGKTTFVDLFLQRAGRLKDVRIARGQCLEGFGGQEPYYPLLEAVGQLISAPDESRLARTLAVRAPTWLIQFPSLVKVDQREALQREILGTTRERMVREISEALEAITVDHPLVLILEDLHWADRSTLDVVSALARRRGSSRLLLLVTRRPPVAAFQSDLSRLHQDLVVHELGEEITLEAFQPPEVSEYLSLEFGHAGFAADLAGLIHRHSGGNPLFVAAIVRDLVNRRMIVREGDTWMLTAPAERIEPGVPESLQQMLNVQFDQLTEAEQGVLRMACVAGQRFSTWAVSGAYEISSNTIDDLCEGLAERRLFIRPAGIGELADGTVTAYYEFHHALHRQAIYRRLSDVSCSRLHRLIGQRLEQLFAPGTPALAPELALHFERAHDCARAVSYLMRTAENAARRFAVRDSVDVLQHALGLVPRLPSHVRVELELQILERIGDAHYVLGAMLESALAYETESALAGRAGLTAVQVQAQSCFARPLGLLDPNRAIAVLQEAAAACTSLQDPLLQARVDMLAAATRLLYDTWRASDACTCEAAHGIIQRADAQQPGFDRMFYSHVQSMQGDCTAALETASAGIPREHETTGAMVHLFALSGQILALLQLGRFGEALRIIRTSREMAEKNGSDPWLFLYREAWLRTLMMDFEGAERLCDALVGSSSVYSTGQAKTIGRLAAGFRALDRGREDEARRCFEEVRDPAQAPNFFLHWYWRIHAHVGVTRAWLQSGQTANARVEADRVTEAALSTADPNLQALAWDTRARVAIAEANWSDAEQSIDNALAALTRFDMPSTWRVHGTAWDLYRKTGRDDTAAAHRAHARTHIFALANSFDADEPLRQAFLSAASVRRIRDRDEAFEREG